MLRSRSPQEAKAQPDPLASVTVFGLAIIAAALLAAAILAVYTYSTPDVELPLVVAIAIAFATVLGVNLIARGLRYLRWRRYQ